MKQQNKIKISIPQTWEEITLKKYQKIINILGDDLNLTKENYLTYISIFLDINEDQLKLIDEDQLLKILEKELKWCKEPIKLKTETTIKYKDVIYTYDSNFNGLTYGEVSSYEFLIEKNKCNYISSMSYILGLLLRKQGEIFDAHKIEPYSNLFTDLPITDCLNIINEFNKWKQSIYINYKPLFGGGKKEEEKEVGEPTFSDRWKWYSIVYDLSQGNILKFPEIYKLNYIDCLNYLSYKKEVNDYERAQRKRQEIKSRSRR